MHIMSQSALFHFIQVSDLHLTAHPDTECTQAKFDAWLKRLYHLPPAELFLLVGDMVDADTLPNTQKLQELLRQIPNGQILKIRGNHELIRNNGGANPNEVDSDAVPLVQSHLHQGVLFVLLDNAKNAEPGAWSEARNGQLRNILSSHLNMPTIIACHYPLVPMRNNEALRASFHPYEFVDRAAAGILEVIDQFKNQIIAVLTAHLHLSGMRRHNGVPHIVTAGLVSWPYEFALYGFPEDRLEIQLLNVSPIECHGKFDQYPLRNGIHDRYPEAFRLDPGYQELSEFITGKPDERQITIPIIC